MKRAIVVHIRSVYHGRASTEPCIEGVFKESASSVPVMKRCRGQAAILTGAYLSQVDCYEKSRRNLSKALQQSVLSQARRSEVLGFPRGKFSACSGREMGIEQPLDQHKPRAVKSSPIRPRDTTASMLAGRIAVRSARVAAPRFQIAATRSFAEAAKPAANSKPPVELFGLDGTYASALVRLRTHPRANGKDGQLIRLICSTPRPSRRKLSTPSPRRWRT